MNKLTLLFVFVSFNLQAQALDDRMSSEISNLESKMTAKDYEIQALDLLNQDGRDNAFTLQAYGRLFESKFKNLTIIKDNFKILEDHIGQCKKWNDLIATTTDSDSKKKKYKESLKIEIKKLADLLEKWDDKKKIDDFKEIVSEINLNESQTVKLAQKNINAAIKELIKKKFDFEYGETGLHELRRTVRWPKIYFEIFSNQTVEENSKCSSSKNDLTKIGLVKNKTVFKSTKGEEAITLNKCAYIKLVGAFELLGNIKDELEKEEILEDKLPKNLREQSEDIYEELLEDVLPKL